MDPQELSPAVRFAGRIIPIHRVLPPAGLEQVDFPVLDLPGTTVFYRAVTGLGGDVRVLNVAELRTP